VKRLAAPLRTGVFCSSIVLGGLAKWARRMQFRAVLAIIIILRSSYLYKYIPIECWSMGNGFKLVETRRKLSGILKGFGQISAG
jgi:hypothetical protein